jgi:hypothetical protein
MKRAAIIGICSAWLAIGPVPLQAQTLPPAPRGKDTAGTGLAAKVAGVFTQPLHPVVKGVVADGGVGAGIAYDFPKQGRWQTSAEAVMTVRGFWSTQLTASRYTPRTSLVAYGRVRDMESLSFFGSGTNSALEDRTLFALREPVVGAVGSVRLSPWVAIGARLEELWPRVAGGRSSRYPSIETRFGEGHAPGVGLQPRFGRYDTFVDVTSDAGPTGTRYQGGRTHIGYSFFDDQQFDRYNFRRLDLETQHRFTVLGPHRLLTLHGWVSSSQPADGNEVPFFMQNTLGGKGGLRSVNEHLIGTDGTDATLRGFRAFRFRDRHLMLLQAEYRWPLWGPIDATVFVDAGKVTGRWRELNLTDLKRNYGFSLGAVRGTNTVVRMDVGFGGGEGTHVFFTMGRVM